MRYFITGASGWIGSALVTELLAHGHEVVGLARSEASADALTTAGAQVCRGDLGDLDVLADAAAASDGVVHLAFRHDIAFNGDFATAVSSDLAAIEAFGNALAGSGKPFAIASGLAGLKPGVLATEQDRGGSGVAAGRANNEAVTLALADREVRSMSVRFAPTVHGEGDKGFISMVIAADRANGTAVYVGDGTNRWPAVHRSDAARLVRLGLESAPAGSVLHAVAEEGVVLRDVAEAIGRGTGLPVTALTEEQAGAHFGFLAGFLAADIPASSERTQQLLSWKPTGPTLLEDLAMGHYFTD